MTLLTSRCRRALLVIVTPILFTSAAIAGPVVGTAELTDGSIGTVSLSYVDGPASVAIDEFTTVPGVNTILGIAKVNGSFSGEFNLGVMGQSTHAHESTFSFSELIANSTAIAQSISLDFLIDAGQLMTNAFEIPPGLGEFLQAGYEITMKFADTIVFQSTALLTQIAGAIPTESSASLATTGTSLGGFLNLPIPGSSTVAQLNWDDYIGNIDLGTLGAGASALFEYDVRTFVRGEFSSCNSVNCGNTRARIGDPFDFGHDPDNYSSIGNLDSFNMAPAPTQTSTTAVPEPGTIGLIIVGLLAFGGTRRRRAA